MQSRLRRWRSSPRRRAEGENQGGVRRGGVRRLRGGGGPGRAAAQALDAGAARISSRSPGSSASASPMRSRLAASRPALASESASGPRSFAAGGLAQRAASAAAYQFAAFAGELRARPRRRGAAARRPRRRPRGRSGDVVGALGRGGPASLQHRRDALVGRELPRGRRRVVDRPPDQRMPEREPPRSRRAVGRGRRRRARQGGGRVGPATHRPAAAASSGSTGRPPPPRRAQLSPAGERGDLAPMAAS